MRSWVANKTDMQDMHQPHPRPQGFSLTAPPIFLGESRLLSSPKANFLNQEPIIWAPG